MSTEKPINPVLELRVALTVKDLERAIRFYSEGLGIEPAAFFENGEGHAVMLELGQATLELFDEAQAEAVDALEAGRRVSGQVRLVLKVLDVQVAVERLAAHGAKLVQAPRVMPWGDINARVEDPDGMQVTLFQEM